MFLCGYYCEMSNKYPTPSSPLHATESLQFFQGFYQQDPRTQEELNRARIIVWLRDVPSNLEPIVDAHEDEESSIKKP